MINFPEHEKSREDIDREGTILAEMLSILEQKDALVTMMEEDRQRCGHNHHHHPNIIPFLSANTSFTSERLYNNLITSIKPCSITNCSFNSTTSLPPCLATSLQNLSDLCSSATSLSTLASLIPDLNYRQMTINTSLLNSQESSGISVSHACLNSSLSPATHFLSLSECTKHFDQFTYSCKPSIFDSDPCSIMCTPYQHARRKVNDFSRLGCLRRTTLPDLSLYNQKSFSIDSSFPYRRFSLSIPLPVHMNASNTSKNNVFASYKSEVKGVHSEYHSNSSLLSTACSCAMIIVVSIWFLPYIITLLSMLVSETHSGLSPF